MTKGRTAQAMESVTVCNWLKMPGSGAREPSNRKKTGKVVENERQRAKAAGQHLHFYRPWPETG
jgi:hypothetical protein